MVTTRSLEKKYKLLHKYVAFLMKICPEGSKIPCYASEIIVTVEKWDLNNWNGPRLLGKETRMHLTSPAQTCREARGNYGELGVALASRGSRFAIGRLVFSIHWFNGTAGMIVLPVQEVRGWFRGHKHFKDLYSELQNYFPKVLVDYLEPFIYPLKIKV